MYPSTGTSIDAMRIRGRKLRSPGFDEMKTQAMNGKTERAIRANGRRL